MTPAATTAATTASPDDGPHVRHRRPRPTTSRWSARLDAPDKPSGWHPVNITHYVMGVAFAGMVLVWALVQGDVVATDELRWLMPIPWLAAGAAGLAATVWPGAPALSPTVLHGP